MPISFSTYLKIFALAYLLSILISATFEDAILRDFVSIYLTWMERFGIKSTPGRDCRFPDPYGNSLRRKLFQRSFDVILGSDVGVHAYLEVDHIEDLPAPPRSPEHSLSIGLLSIIAGGCFLLLMTMFLGLYCCCIRRRSHNLPLEPKSVDMEKATSSTKSDASFKEGCYDIETTIPNRIPVFEFSPPSPSWRPPAPSLASALQSCHYEAKVHPPPILQFHPEIDVKSTTTMHYSRAAKHQAREPRATDEMKEEAMSPSIKILINDEEHDTDAAIAFSSPLIKKCVKSPPSTTAMLTAQARTLRGPDGPGSGRKGRYSGLGISTLKLNPDMTPSPDSEDQKRRTESQRSTSSKSNAETTEELSRRVPKRDTWSRFSNAISQISRTSLAYLLEDGVSNVSEDHCSKGPTGHLEDDSIKEANTRSVANGADKRRKRRIGMIGRPEAVDSNLEIASPFTGESVQPVSGDNVEGDGQAHTSDVLSLAKIEGLPSLGSSSMDSLLAYLSETVDVPSESQPDSLMKKSIEEVNWRPSFVTSTRKTSISKNVIDGPKEILAPPASPLLTLVKNISSQGIKKIGTSSYEAWLSNVPSPILKSPRNEGYRKLQQVQGNAAYYDYPDFESKRQSRTQDRRGLGLQLNDINDTQAIETSKSTNESRRHASTSSQRSTMESRKSQASLPDAQEGLNKALAALDELARGSRSNRRTMSVTNGNESGLRTPTATSLQFRNKQRRKSFVRVRTATSVDHGRETVLPLHTKQKGRSTSIDVNAQSISHRTPKTPTLQGELKESHTFKKRNLNFSDAAVPLRHDISLEETKDSGQDFDVQAASSPRRSSVASSGSANSSPEKRSSQRLDWCRESLTPRFNHLAAILEGRLGNDTPPPLPKYVGMTMKGKTKQA